MTDPFYVHIPNRGLIELEGEDAVPFLQRLISNDMALLETQPAIYACLLTPQGKFLHDFFVSRGPNVILLECEGGARAHDLFERLKKYRLRAKVNISVEDNVPVFACFNNTPDASYPDPRHAEMGHRAFIHPEGAEEKPFEIYDEHRIRLGIPDGSRDAELERSTLAELNLDKLNAVSFQKGCYVGQELTARMEYRGLAKKHLVAITGKSLPSPFLPLEIDGEELGEMRSSCGNVGLALIRDADREKLNDTDQIRLLG
ncbi:MAG: folate-binding protein YgfZ [Pseudobdellovibrionaceae bacterium]